MRPVRLDRFAKHTLGPHAGTYPWRRFAGTEGADMLAWVNAGNVAVMADNAVRYRHSHNVGATLWALTWPLLVEAGDAIGFRPVASVLDKFYSDDPLPHYILHPRFINAALDMCRWRKDKNTRVAKKRGGLSDP
jgi:hypothetical protein